MSENFARPLLNHEFVDIFLEKCVGLVDANFTSRAGQVLKLTNLAQLIRDAENAIGGTDGLSTLTSPQNRCRPYRDDRSRNELRKQVLAELVGLDRLDDDDRITLGVGGAKPQNKEPSADRQAFIIIGLPASGKSTVVNNTADNLGAFIIDSDFAKRKFPEFEGSSAGANLVHEEASEVIFGARSLLDYCKSNGFNVVIPKIGNKYDSIINLRDGLIDSGYQVHLTATILTREQATLRAIHRFADTRRYVPLGLIFDEYANDPIMNYYRFRCEDFKTPGAWTSLGAIDTLNHPATCIDHSNELNPAFLTYSGRAI